MEPVLGGCSSAKTRSSVDLPEPFGPTTAVMRPAGTSSDGMSSTQRVPYSTRRSRSR